MNGYTCSRHIYGMVRPQYPPWQLLISTVSPPHLLAFHLASYELQHHGELPTTAYDTLPPFSSSAKNMNPSSFATNGQDLPPLSFTQHPLWPNEQVLPSTSAAAAYYAGHPNSSHLDIVAAMFDANQDEEKVSSWFYILLSATGLLIALPNGVIVALAIRILLRKYKNNNSGGGLMRGMRAQYCCIASLAGSDMLVGLVTFVIFMSRVQDSILLCQVKISMTITSGLASILHTLLIACDRYLYLLHGLIYHKHVRRSRIIFATSAAWTVSAVIGFAPLVAILATSRQGSTNSSQHQWHGRCYYVEVVPKAYAMFIEAFYVIVGLVPTSVLYVVIVKTAFKQRVAVEQETARLTASSSVAAGNNEGNLVSKESPFKFDAASTSSRRQHFRADNHIRSKHIVKSSSTATSTPLLSRTLTNEGTPHRLDVILEEGQEMVVSEEKTDKGPKSRPTLKPLRIFSSSNKHPDDLQSSLSASPATPLTATTTISSTSSKSINVTSKADNLISSDNPASRRRKITPLLPLMLKPLRPAQRFGAEKRAVTAILLLVVSFAAAWLPHAVAVLAYHGGVCEESARCRSRLAAKITSVFFFIGSLNSLMNPFIYTWGFKELRTYAVNFLKCRKMSVVNRWRPPSFTSGEIRESFQRRLRMRKINMMAAVRESGEIDAQDV